MLLEAFQISLNSFLDILKRFVMGLALGNTTRECRALRHVDAVFVLGNMNSVFHKQLFPV